MIKNDCKPLLVEKGRKDLLRFVRKEICDLEQDEAVEQVTAEMVVENLISKYPENTYTPPPRKGVTEARDKKYAEDLKRVHAKDFQ